ncbi:2-amino-4-hydroxy-6-hydroxymethyldihydropteridine diphosphokinase [Pectinatus sottacetonis]|uniref:2-amino-4-hydroxy-6- hydroxymethyldihydropteridine diphosphokinase n=1 Tax=Pectinatus sottacetonis TaxID=1002795 RepID=UPI0018C55D8C|nr:2-amino-4-hydroxy-6-hydroxymethyldihydropteridine diphosphokinase [Pectinatus sottacetonis]
MDIITIKDLTVYAFHGAIPEENKLGQNFMISAQLFTDTSRAGISDDLDQTINYASVCKFIAQYTAHHTVKLLETAAEQLARRLLINFPLIKKINLTIKKPHAPIGLPVKYTAVTISRFWHESFIAFGSNLGNSKIYITNALNALKSDQQIKLFSISDFYTTTPYGGIEQSDFINGVFKVSTLLTPHELLNKLHKLENDAGRKRNIHWGPRTLDLDILLYDDAIINDSDLIIPHTDMINRDFVMAPLAQLAPYKIHPLLKKSIQELYENIPAEQIHIINKEKISL